MEIIKERYLITTFLIIGFQLILIRGWYLILSGQKDTNFITIVIIFLIHVFISYRTFFVINRKIELKIENSFITLKEGFFVKKIEFDGICIISDSSQHDNISNRKVLFGFKDFFGLEVPNTLTVTNKKGRSLKISGLSIEQIQKIEIFLKNHKNM